ncbi:MAG TPA: class I SAM-dependent methyltransferase [bacterium]|nr:class I SAM-dependent methyltransferase [bacterium]
MYANEKIYDILISPDDKTPLNRNLVSASGIRYDKTSSGIFLLDTKDERSLDIVYKHKMFKKWDSIINERIRYYTENKSIAGILANMGYNSIKYFNGKLGKGKLLLDIGCGDGSQLRNIENREFYIGIDKNLDRLEILKRRYPEVTAIYGDASSLPFKTGTIEYIYSSNAFEHMWYLKEVVYECYRCTYPSGEMVIVFPTEGGLWNMGRKLFSKPHFTRKYPELNFELISRIEHCNNASQIIRTLKTFFKTDVKYLPTRIPTIYLNALVKIKCVHFDKTENHFLQSE